MCDINNIRQRVYFSIFVYSRILSILSIPVNFCFGSPVSP